MKMVYFFCGVFLGASAQWMFISLQWGIWTRLTQSESTANAAERWLQSHRIQGGTE